MRLCMQDIQQQVWNMDSSSSSGGTTAGLNHTSPSQSALLQVLYVKSSSSYRFAVCRSPLLRSMHRQLQGLVAALQVLVYRCPVC